jgi:hypothetical protein
MPTPEISPFGNDRLVEGLQVTLGHAGQQQIPLPRQFIDLYRTAYGTRRVTADRRVQRIETDLGLGDRGHQFKRVRGVVDGRLMPGGDHGQHARQRTDLHRLAIKGR